MQRSSISKIYSSPIFHLHIHSICYATPLSLHSVCKHCQLPHIQCNIATNVLFMLAIKNNLFRVFNIVCSNCISCKQLLYVHGCSYYPNIYSHILNELFNFDRLASYRKNYLTTWSSVKVSYSCITWCHPLIMWSCPHIGCKSGVAMASQQSFWLAETYRSWWLHWTPGRFRTPRCIDG